MAGQARWRYGATTRRCADHDAAGAIVNGNPVRAERPAKWARIERAWWVALVGTMLVFSAFPIVNQLLGLSTKDYGLWYHVGLAVRQGLDVYPRPETGRLFPFMYPPSAAAMLAWISTLGHTGLLLALVLVNSAAWLVCIALSNRLAVDPGMYRHPLVLIIPSFAVIVLIHNIYLLGQPNLLLLRFSSARSPVSRAGETSRLERFWPRLRQSKRSRSWLLDICSTVGCGQPPRRR